MRSLGKGSHNPIVLEKEHPQDLTQWFCFHGDVSKSPKDQVVGPPFQMAFISEGLLTTYCTSWDEQVDRVLRCVPFDELLNHCFCDVFQMDVAGELVWTL